MQYFNQNKKKTNNFLLFVSFQGLPSCPITVQTFRSHLPDISNWSFSTICKDKTDTDTGIASGGNYSKNITSTADGLNPLQSSCSPTGIVPVHKAKLKSGKTTGVKKMPAFRGRRGWCGCLKVSYLAI